MEFTTSDVLRSVKKYVAQLLQEGQSPRVAGAKMVFRPDDAAILAMIDDDTVAFQWDIGAVGGVGALEVLCAGLADGSLSFSDAAAKLMASTWSRADWRSADKNGRLILGSYQGEGWPRPLIYVVNAPGFFQQVLSSQGSWDGNVADGFDPFVLTPGIVPFMVQASASDWNLALSTRRWAERREVLSLGRPYKLVLLDDVWPLSGPWVPNLKDTLQSEQPDDWDVRFFHDAGEFEYPACVIKGVGPTVTRNHGRWYEQTQPITIYAYPTPPALAAQDSGRVQLDAERIRALLLRGFTKTMQPNPAWPGAVAGRIPLYSYDGLDYETGVQGLPDARQPNEYVKVVDVSVDVLPEPNDGRMVAVIADLRVNWKNDTSEDEQPSNVVQEVGLDVGIS